MRVAVKLVAFRVKNFKSIIDTDWCQASSDNITALIGQNEAGKTAVLEALYCFDRKTLKDEYIRDAGVYPEISCRYEFSGDELESILGEYKDEEAELVKKYYGKNQKVMTLTRKWTGLGKDQSTLDVEDDKLTQLLESIPEAAESQPPAVEPTEPVAPEAVATPTPPETPLPAPAEPKEKAMPTLGYAEFMDSVYGITPNMELFIDYDSLLPQRIDLSDIDDQKSKAAGIKGARNFLKIVDLTSADLAQPHSRTIGKKIRTANQILSKEFQQFWRQYIGKSNRIEIEFEVKNHDDSVAELAGKPYLCFWVKDSQELLHPDQRSKGVQWFLSFFLQLKATAKSGSQNNILLIDEPGASLHAKAQEDVLKVFEDIKQDLQIFYTTHSPYLIEPESLYRLLAVQRANVDDDHSETQVFDIHKLGSASRDTLFPVYTLIGVSLDHQKAVKNKNNVILEEPSAYYYLQAFKKLVGETHEINFLPATGVTNIPLLVNLFLGWNLDFVVLTDDDPAGKKVRREIKRDVFGGDSALSKDKLLGVTNCEGIEDLFTKGDFKKHILSDDKLTYAETNSKYALNNNLPKLVLAIKFYKKVKDGKLKITDLNATTQTAIKGLVSEIVSKL